MSKELTPAEYLKKIIEDYKEKYPKDPINNELKADFWKSKWVEDLFKVK